MIEFWYEDLVNEQEVISKALINYCGLEWEEKCLDFYQTERPIFTNPEGVRRPIYGDSVRRWKCYENHLRPLVSALREGRTV